MQRPTQSWPEPQNDMTDIVLVWLLSNLDMPPPNAMLLVYIMKSWRDRVHVQLIFKNVTRDKKVYTKYKSEKYPKQIQHPVIDLKKKILVKITNEFNL